MIDPDRPQAEPPVLAKVFPAGEPLVATYWTCPVCGHSRRGGPPPVCVDDRPVCPVGAD